METKHRTKIILVVTCVCVSLIICAITKPISTLDRQLVKLTMISKNSDHSLPQFKMLYPPESEFISSKEKSVGVDCGIRIQNDSQWPYVIAPPYSLSGYDSLELDLMLDNGKITTLKRRKPNFLSDKGDRIVIPSQGKWEYLISLDPQLWNSLSNNMTNHIRRIRPRFAYGAFMLNENYYRTQEEAENRRKRERDWHNREGELTGNWINYWK